MRQLKGNGKNVAHEDPEDDGNIVVINTCGFIGKSFSINFIIIF